MMFENQVLYKLYIESIILPFSIAGSAFVRHSQVVLALLSLFLDCKDKSHIFYHFGSQNDTTHFSLITYFLFFLKILVRNMKIVNAAQKSTKIPKVIHVELRLFGA